MHATVYTTCIEQQPTLIGVPNPTGLESSDYDLLQLFEESMEDPATFELINLTVALDSNDKFTGIVASIRTNNIDDSGSMDFEGTVMGINPSSATDSGTLL